MIPCSHTQQKWIKQIIFRRLYIFICVTTIMKEKEAVDLRVEVLGGVGEGNLRGLGAQRQRKVM